MHLAVVYVLAWVGCFLGTYLGSCYVGEAYTHWDSAGVEYPNTFYWKARTRHAAGQGTAVVVWVHACVPMRAAEKCLMGGSRVGRTR